MAKRRREKTARYADREMFARLWRTYLHVHRWKIAAAGVLMVIEGATLGILSWMLKPVFDLIFVNGHEEAIVWVGFAIFALFAVRAVAGVVQRIITTRVSSLTGTKMQTDLLRHVLTLDMAFHQDMSPGTMMARVTADANAAQGIWRAIILGAGRDSVALVSLFIVAVSVDPIWTLCAMIGTPLLIVPNLILQRYLRKKSAALRDIGASRSTRLNEVFHGITPVKLNALEAYQHARFSALTDEYVAARTKSSAGSATLPGLIDIAVGLGFFVVLLYGGREIIAGDKTVGDFMSFFSAMTLAFQPLRRLGGLAGTWQRAAASLERVFELFDTVPAVPPPVQNAAPPELPDTTIRFDDVHLSYGESPILRGVDLTAEANRVTALVGPSGAGKSTVFNIVARLVDPTTGTVTIGGAEISELEVGSLRALISVVNQDSMLFDETIRENIVLGRKDVDEAALQRALDAAHVSDFLPSLSAGLDTRVGPRGSNLSGGQRQRVVIARALLRDTPILLLDEATSALDAAAEAKVQSAIESLSEGRTVLVVAHRLSTIMKADMIHVMDRGRIVDSGTHDALLAKGGLYANLYALQFER